MASSSKGKKAFTFKKVTSSVASTSRNNVDCDDDDFKCAPTKVQTKLETVRKSESGSNRSCSSSDQENSNDVTFLASVTVNSARGKIAGCSNDGSKTAWESLMGKMQQNQMEVLQNSRNKTTVKRCLTKSSKSKFKGVARSPVKKEPRLGTNTNAKQFQFGLTQTREDDDEPEEVFLDNAMSPKAVVDVVKEAVSEDSAKPTKMAPVFLPPKERRAIKNAIVKLGESSSLLNSIIESVSKTEISTIPENPNHFDGNTVILNKDEPNGDPYQGLKTKTCPFYKKLPGVPFCVDAFNYGLIPGMEVYFLSHFHSDHYIGLNKKFCKTIICSHPTGNLVKMKLGVEEKFIRKLRIDKPYIICDSEVTQVDANHCPGSVMFIFRLKTGKVILHTGDFRYTSDMLLNPYITGTKIDALYLDTTYCSPEYDFPTQCEAVSSVVTHVRKHLEYRPKTLILSGSYLIGKERVYFTLAEAIGSKVFGNYDKRRILNALENPKFSSMITADENLAVVHVVPMFSISAKNLQEYLAKKPQYTNIIGIKPSGWQFSASGTGCSVKSHYNDTVTILGIPYSEHSSYSELKEFVTTLKPRTIQPTVNVGNPKKRNDMMQHIANWLST